VGICNGLVTGQLFRHLWQDFSLRQRQNGQNNILEQRERTLPHGKISWLCSNSLKRICVSLHRAMNLYLVGREKNEERNQALVPYKAMALPLLLRGEPRGFAKINARAGVDTQDAA
jgi:hypothetical protein